MKLSVFHVDAFTDRLFKGNPASVVLLDRWLPDRLMQAIAAENNLSETAFVVNMGRAYGLRWFTPRVEVPLCGHATLAAAYVLASVVEAAPGDMTFETKSGALTVAEQGGVFTLNFPALPCSPDETAHRRLADVLRAPIAELHVARDRYLCVLDTVEAVRRVEPDFQAMAALPLPGVIATAEGEAPFDFTSRYFAPAKGVSEDPVTGASHCVLVPFWSRRLGRSKLSAYQASQRGGRVACELRGDRVLLGGRATLYMRGHIVVDDDAAEEES
ncbi:MAG: PhzF family phenazine biosynthesis protein [Reyranellaceae bacterium]